MVIPTATYRLQFHAGFGFREARAIVPYLHALGISHVYASPYLRARSGSTHGYDVADPNALNPDLGSEADYLELVDELRRHGLGQVLDIVPNHMGIADPSNVRWLDVLENGPASIYANFFDINWTPLRAPAHDHYKLVVPALGDQYGVVLENGELRVEYADGGFSVAYADRRFPIAPDTYPLILDPLTVRSEGHSDAEELASILTALRHLPPRRPLEPDALEERNREKEIGKRRLRDLYQTSPAFRGALEQALAELNGQPGDPRSFDRLDALLDQQSYRLAFWRVAAEEINYRRFFDITELAAVRIEDPVVFEDAHRLLVQLVSEDSVQGLRIDHPDGLRDPAAYLRRLQERVASRQPYIVVEKILQSSESLPADWPVQGTTGYDFLNSVNGLFVARRNQTFFDTIYNRFLRQGQSRFRDLANSTKKMVMLISLASEVNELGYMLKSLASSDRRHRDFTLNNLTFVIREIIASLQVYRTYINPDTGEATEADRMAIQAAVADAKRRNPRTDPSTFDFVRDTLLTVSLSNHEQDEQLRFIAGFQQTSGPVMAKGAEDTAFYIYNRLVSLNEVGGEPDVFGRSLTAFHRANSQRARAWPASMLATSTHDTKRSEDVRARIDVLSELPHEWASALTRWSRLNGRKKLTIDGRPAPDRNEEYLLYQTLLGTWPPSGQIDTDFRERIVAYMLKALKEAKVNTSWISPNLEYEQAVDHFVGAILDSAAPNPFLDDFVQLQRKVAFFGIFNALSQTTLKLGSPGVADTYQGTELWDFSLVDPDNRRPVDFDLRQRCLNTLGPFQELLAHPHDGRIKLYVTHRLLCARREMPELFVGGGYAPLRGTRHVCAFARTAQGRVLVIAVPVLIATLLRGSLQPPISEDVWRDEWLYVPGDAGLSFTNLFSGQRLSSRARRGRAALPLREVFGIFPVAALLASA